MTSETLKDKVPPHNSEAEQACLGALLLDPDSLASVVRYIRPEDFYLPAHSQIFAAVIALHEKGQKADIITITEEMRLAGSLDRAGGPGYIASLTSMTPSAANVEYYARIIQEMSTRRSLIRLSSEVSSLAFDDTSETGAILDQIQAKIFEITQNRRTASYHSIKELIPDTITVIEQLSNNPNAFTGIPSGLTDLDAMTSGFQNSEFIVIGARPSVGKTALALSFTSYIAIDRKIPAAFFSLEMSERALMNRIISSEAMVPGERIRTGRLRSSDLNDLMDAAGRIYEAPLYIVDMPNMKLLELRTMARRLVLERGEDHLCGLYHPHNPRKRRASPVGTNFGHFPLAQVPGQGAGYSHRRPFPAQAGGRGQAAQPGRCPGVRIHRTGRGSYPLFAQGQGNQQDSGPAIRANRDRAYRRQAT